MKRNLLLGTLCLLLSVPIFGQTLRKAETSLVYYMPYTVLQFDIEYEEITEERGEFYQYSERFLGTTDIVKENRTHYQLTRVSLVPIAKADTSRIYTVPFNEKYPYCSLLSINSKGILVGVNLHNQEKGKPCKTSSDRKEEQTIRVPRPKPLLEEQLIANSTAKMAENTAKQIYRIRESRLSILSGEVEHLPGDGQAMQIVLAELNAQEEALTELFTGRRIVNKRHKSISFVPTHSIDNNVLFRFSLFNGVVANDDMSGKPYYISIVKHQKEYAPADKGDEKLRAYQSPIFYNIPGQAAILLTDGENVLIDTSVDVAQWGIAISLPYSLFTEDTEIRFNTNTGAIKTIRQ